MNKWVRSSTQQTTFEPWPSDHCVNPCAPLPFQSSTMWSGLVILEKLLQEYQVENLFNIELKYDRNLNTQITKHTEHSGRLGSPYTKLEHQIVFPQRKLVVQNILNSCGLHAHQPTLSVKMQARSVQGEPDSSVRSYQLQSKSRRDSSI